VCLSHLLLCVISCGDGICGNSGGDGGGDGDGDGDFCKELAGVFRSSWLVYFPIVILDYIHFTIVIKDNGF